MRRPENRPAPTAYKAGLDDRLSDIDYQLQRVEWARKLTEVNLRSLASDYLQGRKDECTEDAYAEFVRRGALGLLSDSPGAGQSVRLPRKRKGRSSKR